MGKSQYKRLASAATFEE
jgi:hypothetical protein